MHKIKCILVVVVLSTLSANVQACWIDGGFKALEIYDYFRAKKRFEKALKRHTSPAAYGLSVIYLRKDNPFHNLDSAYHYCLLSIEKFETLRPRKKEKLNEKFNFNYQSVIDHRSNLSTYFFNRAKEENTIKAYVDFSTRHPWSPLRDSAIYLREKLAFQYAVEEGTAKAFNRFLKYYGDSPFVEEAEELLLIAQFKETTASNSLKSFERFIDLFPDNPYVDEAHDKIYEIVAGKNTISSYQHFVKTYPNNPNVDVAWMNLYRLSTADYTKESIDEFMNTYPDFPFKSIIDTDLRLVERTLYPYKWNGVFGYMDEKGLPFIPATYENASLFSDGLAAVYKDGKFGFIDKNNELIINFLFDDAQDFEHGRAIVEFNGKVGMIDRTGAFVMNPVYDDIGSISHGFFYAQKDDKYAFYNLKGSRQFNRNFDEAYTFSNGMAKVIMEDTTAFLNTDGTFFIYATNADLRHFNDSLFVYEVRDSLNLIHADGSFILPFFVHRLGNLYENRAIIEKDNKYGYINKNGAIIIPIELEKFPNYFQFGQFKNGHVKVIEKGKYALIDSMGVRIFPPIFSNIGDFGKLTPITRGDKWGYADSNARLVIRYIYDYAYPFINDVAIVQNQGKMGVINLEGENVLPFEFRTIQEFKENYLLVKKEDLFAVYTINGEALTEMEYLRFHYVGKELLQLESNKRIDYFDVSNGHIITLLIEDE